MLVVEPVALDAMARRLHRMAAALDRLAGASAGALHAAGAAVTDPSLGSAAARATGASRAELVGAGDLVDDVSRALAHAAERYRELDVTAGRAQEDEHAGG